jgi:hypothetical protein
VIVKEEFEMSPFVKFLLEHITECAMGLGFIGSVIYIVYKKNKKFTPYRFTTTQYKKKFKKHQIMFNEEFKKTGFFGK